MPPTNLRVPFDSLTLCAVAHELRERLIGGQIQDIRQPNATELFLGIRSNGRNYVLALSCDARFARAHLTLAKPPNAATPPSFCMAVRKHCEGAVVRDIRQRGFDRVLEIEIGVRSGEADTASVTLMAELMGKHSNLILVSAAGIVIESAKRVSHRINRVREVLPGVPYLPPPEQPGKLDPFDPATVSTIELAVSSGDRPDAAAIAALLTDCAAGMSPFLAANIAAQLTMDGSVPEEWLRVVWSSVFGAAARREFRPVIVRTEDRIVGAYPFPVVTVPREAQGTTRELNAALDLAFTAAIARDTFTSAAAELRGQIDRDRKRLLRQKEIAGRTLGEAARAVTYRESGELLLANLWKLEPGAASITVQDYFDPELGDRTISLDPKLSPQENTDALFRKYRKATDGQATAAARLSEAEAQLVTLEAARVALDQAGAEGLAGVAEIRRLREALRSQGFLTQHAGQADGVSAPAPDFQGHKIRRIVTPEGCEILIGETATANDFLTTRLAAPNDLWLHVRAATSAHVVIRTHGRPEAIPRSAIQHAAELCARHSSQKHSSLVSVDYTLKKHVRKPRGAAPGSADYQWETTLEVTP